jgi:D-alanyl-D-alanine carboxypeptidase
MSAVARTWKWVLLAPVLLLGASLVGCSTGESAGGRADKALDQAIEELVNAPSGPPGVVVVVQRGSTPSLHVGGVSDVGSGRKPTADDYMRIASVSKAFSGGVALSLVDHGTMSLDDTVGKRLPDAPDQFKPVTLRELLSHTSGIPDFINAKGFSDALSASLDKAPAPRQLIDYVRAERLSFAPGSRYEYSNSDNIFVGLMVEAATGRSYVRELQYQVLGPLGLRHTSLPSGTELPEPLFHGYDVDPPMPPEDVSNLLAGGWAWASGGIVSTPRDLNSFIRGYVGSKLFNSNVAQEQRHFVVAGGSEPTGPGDNSAGLALFRYDTACGTVYGHTGNIPGYTQFAAASADGHRSVTVAMSLQRTQTSEDAGAGVYTALQHVWQKAICAALAAD